MKPYYQDSKVTSYQGHILDVLPALPDESVHCVVTSPPYWGLRDYGLPPQVWDELNIPENGCTMSTGHEWGEEIKSQGMTGGIGEKSPIASTRPSIQEKSFKQAYQGQFCHHCNAWRGSLGLEPTPELYIQHIVQVFREIWKVLRKDGTVWLNLGDSYASGGRGSSDRHRQKIGVNTANAQALGRKVAPAGLKDKDLCGIPWRVALVLQADGWWLRSDIIWNKPNPMPESCTDRPTSSHEYVFLLTKSGTSKFWTHRDKSGTRAKPKADYRWVNQITDEEVAVAPLDWKDIIICPNCQGTGIAMIDLSCEVMGQWMESWIKDKCPVCDGKKKVQKWKRINLWRGHDYFYDQEAVREPLAESTLADGRNATGRHTQGEKQGSKYFKNENVSALSSWYRGKVFVNPELGRNLRSVWTIATQPFPDAHFATFPEKLVEPWIKAGTSEKGCCPECGSPWIRITEKPKPPEHLYTKTTRPNDGLVQAGQRRDGVFRGSGQSVQNWRDENPSKTIGWKSSCKCMPDSINGSILQTPPCTVLDPFGGSGRTAIVAKKLGRKCIIIELKPEYCEMPLDELRQENIF